MTHPKRTTVSAPGKVLLVGGYLVLDRMYSGLVVGSSSRFYVTVTATDRQDGSSANANPNLQIRSPQFLDGNWEYEISGIEDGCLNLVPADSKKQNRYVETAVLSSLKVALASNGAKKLSEILGSGLEITVLGDNDFYSQTEQLQKSGVCVTTASLKALKPYCPTNTTISNVHKTGLGSSAAMITSLVGSLMEFLGVISLKELDNTSQDLLLVHNLAQYAHCLAQGKIGSGFDVSAAVYGSHSYKRFSPAVLESVMQDDVEPSRLYKCVSDIDLWDGKVEPFRLPPAIHLMLGDIDSGSNTPKLVLGILSWRKAKPEEANPLWHMLNEKNLEVESHLRSLLASSTQHTKLYDAAVDYCSLTPSAQWRADSNSVISQFVALYNSFTQVRCLLQEMSKLSGVPVEPAEQTRLLDATSAVNGVVIAGVPGAGGYDAIFVLIVERHGDESNRASVEQVWREWSEMTVSPLLASESSKGLSLR